MLLTNRNKDKFSPKWAFGRGRGRAVKVEKPRERGRRALKRGLGGPAVAVKPRAPRKVSPAQGVMCIYFLFPNFWRRQRASRRNGEEVSFVFT